VSSEHSINTAVVPIDITGAVTYGSEDLTGLNDSYALTPGPSKFFGLRTYQRTSRGYLANPFTKIQVAWGVVREIPIIMQNLFLQRKIEET
jgi:hypothetical protein